MRDDVIAKALEALKLRGTVYFEADFRAPWGMAIPAKDVAAFHMVANGRCWLRAAGREPTALATGDIVLFPHGDAHELAHEPEATAQPAQEILRQVADASKGNAVGGSGDRTRLICGHFSYRQRALHPFFETLPNVLHVTSDGERATWLAAASRLAAAESATDQRSASVVVDRLAEALLMQTLREVFDRHPQSTGFLAAARDPHIGQALAAIHGDVAENWSLDTLARHAGMSRSVFSERFRSLVGESPMKYVARWRMLQAHRLLDDSSLSVAAIASRVGYQSEFAFSRTFKRFFGESPGSLRRSA